jgi:Cu(I)/Ag(I) efflux system protein CusF
MRMKSIRKAIIAGSELVMSTALFAQTVMTEGEVRKIDKETRKITLKHDEIKNLDMP